MEVPTILYFLKQKVGILLPRRGVAGGGTQGFLPGQSSSSSSSVEQFVHTPAGRGECGGLQRFLPRHGSSKRTAEQIADIPVPGGLGHDFFQILIRHLVTQICMESRNNVFFALFPDFLKCDNCFSLEASDSSPSTGGVRGGCVGAIPDC